MKKAIIAALALSAILFAACDSKENEQSAITVADNSALTQEVYADKTEAAGVKITTTGAWTSYVSEKQTSAKSPQMRAADSPAWISINPASGKEAGSYTIVITLTPNTTGEDRTAIIIITCEDTTITVTITQKATKEDGEIPTSFDGKITGQITGDAASLADVVEIKAFDYKEEWVVATAPVQNGNFTLALPETVENNRLSSFNLESSITLSDANVKQTHINLGEGSCLKVYGNAEKLLGYVHCFSADKKTAIHAFMYVDRDCKITGSVDRVTYNVDLKTGWNIIYGKVLNNNVDFELTTTKPDVELRWSVRWFEQYPTSGYIGSVHWEIANNTLTISGSGWVPGMHSTDGSVPWDLYNSGGTPQFEHVVIQDGITQIGTVYYQAPSGQSFYHCGDKILTYDIAASVTAISPDAFANNNNVREIKLHWTAIPVLATGPYTYNNTYQTHFGIAKEDYSTITLSVPNGTADLYRAKAGLRDFNIVER